MITVSNTYIPESKRRRTTGDKEQDKPIAKTEAGDVAYYTTEHVDDYDLVSDEDLYGKPQASFTGAEWMPCFNDRMTVFISGVPGAGKSWLAKDLIGLLPSTYDILLFTALEEKDGNFESLGKERLFKIKMTPENLEKINLAEIRKR